MKSSPASRWLLVETYPPAPALARSLSNITKGGRSTSTCVFLYMLTSFPRLGFPVPGHWFDLGEERVRRGRPSTPAGVELPGRGRGRHSLDSLVVLPAKSISLPDAGEIRRCMHVSMRPSCLRSLGWGSPLRDKHPLHYEEQPPRTVLSSA